MRHGSISIRVRGDRGVILEFYMLSIHHLLQPYINRTLRCYLVHYMLNIMFVT